MKAFQNKEFQPVCITIETQDELNWLMACLCCSTNVARANWTSMGKGKHTTLDDSRSMDMYNQILKFFK